jgi:hypothetical protein
VGKTLSTLFNSLITTSFGKTHHTVNYCFLGWQDISQNGIRTERKLKNMAAKGEAI